MTEELRNLRLPESSIGRRLEDKGYESVKSIIFRENLTEEIKYWLDKRDTADIAVLPLRESINHNRAERGSYLIYVLKK